MLKLLLLLILPPKKLGKSYKKFVYTPNFFFLFTCSYSAKVG